MIPIIKSTIEIAMKELSIRIEKTNGIADIPKIKNITIDSPTVLMKKGLASLNAFFSRIFSPENFCLAIITDIEAKIK